MERSVANRLVPDYVWSDLGKVGKTYIYKTGQKLNPNKKWLGYPRR